ncbi:MAG: hypothetical protein AAFV98_18260 [Chloroflexota bacterium]
MSDKIEWIEKPNIVGITFTEQISINSLNHTMVDFLKIAQKGEVYIMLDFSQIRVPAGLLSMPSLLQLINHANTRWMGVVKRESSSSVLTKMLARDKVKMFRSSDDALGFLRGMVRIDAHDKQVNV